MSTRLILRIFSVSSAVFVAGCTALPSSGPDSASIEKHATIVARPASKEIGFNYALVELGAGMISAFEQAPASSIRDSFAGGRGGPPNIPLGIGDVIQVSIFEAQAGGLFIPTEVAGSRPGNYITLPAQTIDRTGEISIPYAGRIRAAGKAKQVVEKEIEKSLSNRAIEPQVVITTVESHSDEVAVLGDVNRAGKIKVTSAGDRVLDVISSAGGISTPNIETYVTIQRSGRVATASYDKLQTVPAENIFVIPGDTILVNRERRTFSAFGATGFNGRIDFEETRLTLGEALAKAGGLLDSRADPSQVLLYRTVDRLKLQNIGIDTSRFATNRIPVIFRANLRDPSTFFAVQKFAMQDKDMIYISNSDSVEVEKFFNIVRSGTSPALDASQVIRNP